MEQQLDRMTNPTLAKGHPGGNHLGKAKRVVIPKADAVKVDDPPNQVQLKIPNFSQTSNFEQQIWEIDVTISGGVPVLKSKPHTLSPILFDDSAVSSI
ncbi:hypothetical protein CMV_020300 [Castanea mollissima]|uniref:Uncharacterized protein n=1 Tax=Castanea mollissima TaxID=60419 RepID=A0A8J4VMU9_9ROSI|nr:hypothetical protein CMV_020300 [Castanea mollissima]